MGNQPLICTDLILRRVHTAAFNENVFVVLLHWTHYSALAGIQPQVEKRKKKPAEGCIDWERES